MSRESNILFDDIFTITDINAEGKRFDRVSRLMAKSQSHAMHLALDYNVELYPLRKGETFTLALASSLSREVVGADEESTGRDVWRPDRKGSVGIEEDYECVMYGKVYKFDEGSHEMVTAYASFGGLLMALTGSYRHMQNIVIGENVYLLMRR
ncbi:RNA polymerase [Cantharellus anzutake]|uniref:RNA polymerase n=1 Tax=Cantharellus anzutake TaxID=1750568 RepID=UPI001905EB81|nr:RNA polymerase [Cantharellus anzutake]KAF8329773.1 RNA polymerase [Cantharellus anzutake]